MDEQQIDVNVSVTDAQLVAIDHFRDDRQLPSREAAVRWLIDIALESVTGSGRRFWDRPLSSGSKVARPWGQNPADLQPALRPTEPRAGD